MAAWLIVLVIGLPWLGAFGIWLASATRPGLQISLAVGATLMAGILSLALLPFASTSTALSITIGSVFGNLSFVPDGLGCFLAAIASVIGCLTVIFSVAYMHGEPQSGRYYSLILIFIGAMSGLVLTNNLFLLVFFWEIVAFCSYALISFYGTPQAIAGGIKALIVTQIGGIGLLAGVLIVYSYTGSYQIDAFLGSAGTLPPTALAIVAFFFLAAAAAKSAQIPFHTWLPGAMEAPTPVSALIHAATMVNAGIYLLARFYPAFSIVPGWTTTVIAIGALSALLAAALALVATDLKRVLAYSTISQLGFMVYAVGIGAIFASQFHLLSHAVFKALLFLMAGVVTHAVETRDLRKMGHLGSKMPFVALVAWVGALALIGVPIFNGFWSKELILEAGATSSLWLAFAAMLVAVFLTTLYTVRMMWLVFYGTARHAEPLKPISSTMKGVLAVLAAGTLSTWLLGGAFSTLLANTLPHHALPIASLFEIANEVSTAPTTLAVMVIIVFAVIAWLGRTPLIAAMTTFKGVVDRVASSDWGFEWLNDRISQLFQYLAARLQKLQTGQLNWNMVGVVLSLAVILFMLGVLR